MNWASHEIRGARRNIRTRAGMRKQNFADRARRFRDELVKQPGGISVTYAGQKGLARLGNRADSNRRSQRAHREQFVGGEWLDLRFAHGDNIDGFSDGVEDFQGVARLLTGAAGMKLDDGGHVATTQARFGQVFREGHADEEVVFPSLPGSKVTNLVSSALLHHFHAHQIAAGIAAVDAAVR